MNVDLEPGTYVVAVSGGVDSVVLLDLLIKLNTEDRRLNIEGKKKTSTFHLPPSTFRLIVAHYDHGIRADSELDRELVQDIAGQHGLAFVFDMGRLGPNAGEAAARVARYKFLHKVRAATGAEAVITAHHQDDLIETAILNLLRGTGRKGLSSLGSEKNLRRPLLHVPKKTLYDYAKKQGLKWHEDVTNKDTKYRRNYVRENIISKLTPAQRKRLLQLLTDTKTTNQTLDKQIGEFLPIIEKDDKLDRALFINLPHSVALEIMAAWLRRSGIRQFDKKLLEKLVTQSKTLAPGKQLDINATHVIKITKQTLVLENRKI